MSGSWRPPRPPRNRDPQRARRVLRVARPASVRSDGERCTVRPRSASSSGGRASGYSWSRPSTPRIQPKSWQAKASDEPHWPAPVSVVSFLMPAGGVLVGLAPRCWLCEPAGETPSYCSRCGRRVERLLQPAGAEQRRGPPQLVGLAHRLRDLDLRLGRDLLEDQRHREDRREVIRSRRLLGPRVQRGGASPGRSAMRLTQCVGMSRSASVNLTCASPISLSFGSLAPRFYGLDVSVTCAVSTVSVRAPLRTVTFTVTANLPVLASSARPVRSSASVSAAL